MSTSPSIEKVTQPDTALRLVEDESIEETFEISAGGRMIRDHVESAGLVVALVSKDSIEFPDLKLTYLRPPEADFGRD